MDSELKEIQDWHDPFRAPGIDLMEVYKQRASDYEEVVVKAGVVGHKILVELAIKHLPAGVTK